MSLFLAILAVALSIVIVTYGANFLTDGSVSLAKKFNVSPLIIGLTIVAFGTSAPELAVSLSASLSGSSGISLGNVVGSNLFNILVVLGVVAIVTPLKILPSTAKLEIPFLVIIGVLLMLFAKDTLFFGGTSDLVTRGEGGILLLIFAIFLLYIIHKAKKEKGNFRKEVPSKEAFKQYGWIPSISLFVLGLAMLIGGGTLFSKSAIFIAHHFNVSEAVIGITVVATGTSIPELATSIVAARKKQVDMAVGNIVGSNIFNTLLIPGLVALIRPINSEEVTPFDFSAMITATLLLLLLTLASRDLQLNRLGGVCLFAGYILYAFFTLY